MSVDKSLLTQSDLDYKRLFKALPDLYVIIAADPPTFTVIDANKAHMESTRLKREDFIGKPFFDIWPDISEKYKQTGISDVKESLLRVVETGEPDHMGITRYDIPLKAGGFLTKYWKPEHYPKKGKDGRVRFIIQASRDVTDEVTMNQKLGHTKRQLDEALSVGLVGVWVWDLRDKKVYADKSLAKMFGLDSKESENGVPLNVFVKSIHPEDRKQVKKLINDTLQDGGEYEMEYRIMGPEGDIRWVIARGHVEHDTHGKAVQFPGVIVDITDRKAVEEALEKSESQLRFMAESMPLKVFTATSDGTVDYYNPQWLSYTGLSAEQLDKEGWMGIIHPDDLEESVQAWEHSFAAGEEFNVENRFRRSDGEYRWHLNRATPMYDENGKVLKWVGTSVDIAERKQEELNNAFLANATKTLTSSLDYDDTLKQVAELAVPDIADWCAVDILAPDGSINQVAVVHKDPAKIKWAKEYRERSPVDINSPSGTAKVIRTGTPEYYPVIDTAVLEQVTEDKKAIKLAKELGLYSAMVVPLKVEDKPIGAISFISAEQQRHFTETDLNVAMELAHRASLAITNANLYKNSQEEISRRKELQQKLLEANEKLEVRVLERTALLEESNKNYERSNEELQNFAYVASHDLQEPLRKIQAFGNLLEDEYAESLDDGRDYLDRMQKAASRMSILIEDLLAFSRVTTQARPFVPVDLNKIAEEVIDDLETRISQTKGKIKTDKLPTVQADPTQMRQLFQNLLGNALKFHRPDTPPVVIVAYKAKKTKNGNIKEHVLSIKDNGIGFDEKYLDRIFSVFQRLHGRDSYEGTGIGLAVCRKIIERHGGTITAKSTSGEGATFIITLPVATEGGTQS